MNDLRTTLDQLGLSQAELARLTDASHRKVPNRWLSGVRAAPHWLRSWLAMYETLTDEQRKAIWP